MSGLGRARGAREMGRENERERKDKTGREGRKEGRREKMDGERKGMLAGCQCEERKEANFQELPMYARRSQDT